MGPMGAILLWVCLIPSSNYLANCARSVVGNTMKMARLDLRRNRLFQRVAQCHSSSEAIPQGQSFDHRKSYVSLSVLPATDGSRAFQTQAITLTLLFRSVGAVSASPSHAR